MGIGLESKTLDGPNDVGWVKEELELQKIPPPLWHCRGVLKFFRRILSCPIEPVAEDYREFKFGFPPVELIKGIFMIILGTASLFLIDLAGITSPNGWRASVANNDKPTDDFSMFDHVLIRIFTLVHLIITHSLIRSFKKIMDLFK